MKRLGDILLQSEAITREQLKAAIDDQQKEKKESLGKILVRLGYLSEDEVASFVGIQVQVEKVDPSSSTISADVLKSVPESFARERKVIPLSKESGRLTVAMTNPLDIRTMEEITHLTGLFVDPKIATETDVSKALDKFYKKSKEHPIEAEPKDETKASGEEELALGGEVVRKVDQVLIQAIERGATDIHLEPKEKGMRCRFRIDGILRDGMMFPKTLQGGITNRIKILSNLNISESRLPQDGRFIFPLGRKKTDLRVSTFPTIFGEKIVLRVLDRERLVLGLEQLGLSRSNLHLFKNAILRPHGIILVTGPTGSGKTTTLYSALSCLNSKEKNVITLEDPVEYEFPEITQSAVHVKTGHTFATGLRSILRQDPDVILVGEIRDFETVEVAIRAAITGHLVLSTLHTNDSVSTIARLLDMEVESYLLASALIAILSQRLVRVICPSCKERAEPDRDLLSMLKEEVKGITEFYRGRGCNECYSTGYKGRIGIFELLYVSPTIASLITKKADSLTIKDAALKEGMITMMKDGLEKVRQGITTLEEVVRVAYGG